MNIRAAAPSPNTQYLAWLLFYALLIVYASTVVGPSGLNFVPLDITEAWQDFKIRAFTWVIVGSDQRSDLMGNLIMFVPFGFLMAGSLSQRRDIVPNPFAVFIEGCAALALALAFVLAVKFAQLFFPPRTVMLNYVVSQCIGSVGGIIAFHFWRGLIMRYVWRGPSEPRERIRLILNLYACALFMFVLMPLDFAFSRADLLVQFNRLPGVIVGLHDASRPPVVHASLLVAGGISTIPFGMLMVLGPRERNRSLGMANARGFFWMAVLWTLSLLVISGMPSLLTLAMRTVGIVLGSWGIRWLLRQDVYWLRYRLSSLSVWAAMPYLLLLLAVNGLFSLDWSTPNEAVQSINALGLLPLFNYYIVSKATMAKNIVSHAVMYAPIGLFFWLNDLRATTASACALLLALMVEAARYMRLGLQGDVNAVAVAGVAAFLTARALPIVWGLLKGVTLTHNIRLNTVERQHRKT